MTIVRYLGTPVALFIELQESLDGFQREVQLSSLDGAEPVGQDVVEGMVIERDTFVDLRLALHDQAVAAIEAGLEHADLEAEFPDDAADKVLMITAAARQADQAAEEGRLLTPPVREEVRRVQTWMLAQVEAQLRGGPATPYDPDAGTAS
ncbi:MAG TPA: hypothetical protein VF228_00730 [Iamia sp.]